MKKNLLTVLGILLIVGTMAACGNANKDQVSENTVSEANAVSENTEASVSEVEVKSPYIKDEATGTMTYEFETFDGQIVVIDGSNIFFQKECENPLEWDQLPAEAEQLAPGRDFILFADDSKYYVEDAVNNIVTVANKEAVKMPEKFSNGKISFDYYEESFYVREEDGSVIASYINENVEVAGSNVVEIKEIENTDIDTVAKEYQGKYNIADENVSDSDNFGIYNNKTKILTTSATVSEESVAKTRETVFVIENGDNVVVIDVFRHIGSDEYVEMGIDDSIALIFDSLEF